MDQEQVDLVEAEVGQGLVEGLARHVGLVEAVVELAGDEQLVARDPGGADRLADALLVAVHLGGVDVPVAGLEGLSGDPRRVLRRDLEHAEAELGDGVAVVQGQVRNLGHTNCLHIGPPNYSPAMRLDVRRPTMFGSRQVRSKGSRHARGAISWWIRLGPHVPCP